MSQNSITSFFQKRTGDDQQQQPQRLQSALVSDGTSSAEKRSSNAKDSSQAQRSRLRLSLSLQHRKTKRRRVLDKSTSSADGTSAEPFRNQVLKNIETHSLQQTAQKTNPKNPFLISNKGTNASSSHVQTSRFSNLLARNTTSIPPDSSSTSNVSTVSLFRRIVVESQETASQETATRLPLYPQERRKALINKAKTINPNESRTQCSNAVAANMQVQPKEVSAQDGGSGGSTHISHRSSQQLKTSLGGQPPSDASFDRVTRTSTLTSITNLAVSQSVSNPLSSDRGACGVTWVSINTTATKVAEIHEDYCRYLVLDVVHEQYQTPDCGSPLLVLSNNDARETRVKEFIRRDILQWETTAKCPFQKILSLITYTGESFQD